MEFYFNSPSFQPAGEQHTLLLEGVTRKGNSQVGAKARPFTPNPCTLQELYTGRQLWRVPFICFDNLNGNDEHSALKKRAEEPQLAQRKTKGSNC